MCEINSQYVDDLRRKEGLNSCQWNLAAPKKLARNKINYWGMSGPRQWVAYQRQEKNTGFGRRNALRSDRAY